MKDRFYLEDDKLKQLIIYKTDGGRYAVRPMNWAGAWDEKGRIKESLNHLALFIEKEDAEKEDNEKEDNENKVEEKVDQKKTQSKKKKSTGKKKKR